MPYPSGISIAEKGIGGSTDETIALRNRVEFDFWYPAILIIGEGVVVFVLYTSDGWLIAVYVHGVYSGVIHKVKGSNIINARSVILVLVCK